MIEITLQDEFYHEILNTRDFGMADLWASIGGYVGVFCGIASPRGFEDIIQRMSGEMRFKQRFFKVLKIYLLSHLLN